MCCPEEVAVHEWNKSLEQLDNWMAAMKMSPQLCQDILAGLCSWHDDQPPDVRSPGRSKDLVIQDTIGWGLTLEGCVVLCWHKQDKIWKACKSTKSSK